MTGQLEAVGGADRIPVPRGGLPAAALAHLAFPFHLRLDAALRVTSFGRSLPKLCPGVAVGDRLDEHVRLLSSTDEPAVDLCDVTPGTVLLATSVATGVDLRCQYLADGDERYLLVNPWLPDPTTMERLGLRMGDFAAHDTTPDTLLLMQTQTIALDEARRLAERLSEAETELRRQVVTDPLTAVTNRRGYAEQLDEVTASGPALLIVDIDDLGSVNETYGQWMGDAVLCTLAERVGALLVPGELLARVGGDEFAVLLPGTAVQRADVLAEQIMDVMREPVAFEGRQIPVRITIGMAAQGDGPALARYADIALLAAKRAGRGRIVRFDATLHESLLHRGKLRERLGAAVGQGEIKLVYQPLVDVGTGRIHGFEVLSRWHDSVLGPIPPNVFIELAEETGLIGELGMYVLRDSTRQLAAWQARYPQADLTMSVNLSPRQLDDPNLPQQVADALAAAAVPARQVQLEITESAFGAQRDGSDVLHRLRELGTPLAIDDFGASESSLGRLHKLPVSTLKIDRAFLIDMEEANERCRRLLGAVAAIADALSLATVAEGVETVAHWDAVREAGCTYGQGYLFARPMPPQDAEEYLAREFGPPPAP